MSFLEISNDTLPICQEALQPKTTVDDKSGNVFVIFITGFLLLLGILNYGNGNRFKGLKFRRKSGNDNLPGPRTIPILGNGHILLTSKDIEATLANWSRQYKPCFRLLLGYDPVVFLTTAEAVGKLLTSNDNGHLAKSHHYAGMMDYLDEGLVTSYGEKWRSRRKLLSPLFNYKCFSQFLEVFNRHSKLLIQNIDDMFQDDLQPKQIQNAIFTSLFRIICETSMGIELNDNYSGEFDKFFVEAERCKHYIWNKSTIPWYKVKWIWKLHPFRQVYEENVKYIKNYIFKVIQEARKNFVDHLSDKSSFKTAMDLMLAKGMSDPDIREEAHTLISAGHETTAASIQFALLLLALHPEHQKRCQEEVDRVYNDESKCPEGNFTMSALSELKYTERCTKEALRMYPVANVTTRKLDKALQIDDNVTLPPGTSVAIAATNLHKNAEYFPNPDMFDPNRFTPENCLARHPFAYIPFSGGPRLCLGYKFASVQMKLVIARILYNFDVTTTDAIDTVPLEPSVILTPKRGYNFIFTRRH